MSLTITKEGVWKKITDSKQKEWRAVVEYARSGRARCRRCGEMLEKGQTRIGFPIRDPRGEFGYISAWSHPPCTRVDDPDDFDCDASVFGFSKLKSADQDVVRLELRRTDAPKHLTELDTEEIVKRGPLKPRDPPPELLQHLLPYQKEGLGWMCEQEEVGYEGCNGGLLADEMGMGKTIQMISLIVSRKGHGPTLVVTPTSSMMQWMEEIKMHTTHGALKVIVFHGTSRCSAEHIMEADVVLTTYNVVETQLRKITNVHKKTCEYCGKSLLPRKMAVHLKYFCGPNAVKTMKQSKQEKKKRQRTVAKGLKTLKVIQDGETVGAADEESDGETTTKRRKSNKNNQKPNLATPMNVYRELMAEAGRKAHGRFEKKSDFVDDGSSSNSDGDDDDSSFVPSDDDEGVKRTSTRADSLEVVRAEPVASLPSDTRAPQLDLDLDRSDTSAHRLESTPTTLHRVSSENIVDDDTPLCKQLLPQLARMSTSPCPPSTVAKATQVCADCEFPFKKFKYCPKTGKSHESALPPAPLPEDEVDMEGFEDLDITQSVLHSVTWFRVILDEAHKIKDKTTSTAKSVYALRASHKWCLTGTPLQNRVGELFSLIRFLRFPKFSRYYCGSKGCHCTTLAYPFSWDQHRSCRHCGHGPLQHYNYFNKHVMNPIRRYGYVGDGRKAMSVLKEHVLDRIMLRRTKAERAADLHLPQMQISVQMIDQTPEERDFYESLYKRSEAKFDTFVHKGTLLHNYAHIFDLLSSLRQALDHPYIVLYRETSAELPDVGVATAMPAMDVCAICQDNVLDPSAVMVTKPCMHTFHKACMAEYVHQAPEGTIGCPKCFTPLTLDVRTLEGAEDEDQEDDDTTGLVPVPPPGLEAESSPQPAAEVVAKKLAGRKSLIQKISVDKFQTSTKLETIARYVKGVPADDKVIVFSQYANMLDLVEWRLEKAGVRTAKLLGSMPVVMRQAMLQAFRNPESETKVILISLKAGGEGLNLQVANHVILIDPWWNPAVEMQAIQRAHRIGQHKTVHAVRLITRNTIEERMLELQSKKMLVFEGTIDAQRTSLARLSEEDLKFLFTR